MDTIKTQLLEHVDPSYKAFQERITPNVYNILGVRSPILRKMAKQLAKEKAEEYLKTAKEDSYEEVMLQGMVIGYYNAPFITIQECIRNFIPKINNWAVCDTFVGGLKITNTHKEEMYSFLIPYLESEKEYEIRFGVVMLLTYYIDKAYINDAFHYFDSIKKEAYYVKTAVAWAISFYYIAYPKETLAYLKTCSLDDFTYNKALSKICESRVVSPKTKQKITVLRRKNG